jgi:hypothetical protein
MQPAYVLYQPSIHSKIADRAAARLGHGRSPISSRFKVAKKFDLASACGRASSGPVASAAAVALATAVFDA